MHEQNEIVTAPVQKIVKSTSGQKKSWWNYLDRFEDASRRYESHKNQPIQMYATITTNSAFVAIESKNNIVDRWKETANTIHNFDNVFWPTENCEEISIFTDQFPLLQHRATLFAREKGTKTEERKKNTNVCATLLHCWRFFCFRVVWRHVILLMQTTNYTLENERLADALAVQLLARMW